MKAISLWQPWASAIPAGLKHIETRGWATTYRGPLAIHAARLETLDLRMWWETRVTRNVEPAADYMPGAAAAFAGLGIKSYDDLPRGAVVATCEVVECRPTEWLTSALHCGSLYVERFGQEWKWGDYRPCNNGPKENGKRRWGWVLANVMPLAEPVPFTGRQGFFDVPDELLRIVA